MVVIVAIPLTAGTVSVALDQLLESRVTPLAQDWASQNRWLVTTLTVTDGEVIVTALGSPPDADPAQLRRTMNANGMGGSPLTVRLALGGSATCPANSEVCTRN
jgi:hypothetical protein